MEAQPGYVLLYGVHEFLVLLGGVGVVVAQVAAAAELFSHGEVDGQRLCVAYVQVAVGLRREAGLYVGKSLFLYVLFDEFLDKVLWRAYLFHGYTKALSVSIK